MKTALRSGLIVVSLIIVAFAGMVYMKTGNATAEGELVGYVDSDEIIAGFPEAAAAQQAWANFERTHEQELEKKLFEKYQTYDFSTLSPEQQAEVQKMLLQADEELKDQFDKIREMQWDPARDKIQKAIDEMAKEKGVRVVLEKKAVLSGGIDMTEDVLKKLNKK